MPTEGTYMKSHLMLGVVRWKNSVPGNAKFFHSVLKYKV